MWRPNTIRTVYSLLNNINFLFEWNSIALWANGVSERLLKTKALIYLLGNHYNHYIDTMQRLVLNRIINMHATHETIEILFQGHIELSLFIFVHHGTLATRSQRVCDLTSNKLTLLIKLDFYYCIYYVFHTLMRCNFFVYMQKSWYFRYYMLFYI